MFARPSMKTAALGAAALSATAMLLAPATASAQVYSYQGSPQAYGYDQSRYGYDRSGYGYDQSGYGYNQPGYGQDRSYDRSGYDHCRTDRRQRQGAGVAVGATFGAIVGSQLGARGRRTEGSALGAVIGGALGAAVGSDSARDCRNQAQYGYEYDNRGYSDQSRYGSNNRGYSDQSRYGYEDRGYSNQGYGDPYRAADRYDDRGYQYQPDNRYQSDCRPVAVSTRDNYGRVVTRYQQTC